MFSGLGFALSGGEALLVTGRNGAGKSSLLRMLAGLLRIAGGQLALAGGDPDKTIPEQAHYLGHQDALKPSLTVAENLAFWARYLGGSGAAASRHSPPSDWRRWPICRPPTCRPASGGGCRSPGWWPCRGRSGCSTSRPRRSTARRRICWPGLMRRHLSGGGLIVAAAHGPIGLEPAKELRLGEAA